MGPLEAMVPSPKPTLQAFLLADHIYMDVGTGKKIIAGVFFNVRVPKVPFDFPGCWAYACLKGVPNKFTVQLRLIELNTLETVAASPAMPVEHPAGRLIPHEFMLQVPPLAFQHAGAYDFELVIDDEPLKGCQFTVTDHSASGDKHADHDEG